VAVVRSRRAVAAVGFALSAGIIAAGCSGEQAAGPGYVVQDSSGVRVVESDAPAPHTSWRLVGSEPVFRTGWRAADPQWGSVVAGSLLPDGRAAVADRLAAEVAWLGADGTVELVAGGPGEGPGELGPIFGLAVLGHDTVVVQEMFGGRTTLFHAGSLVRTLAPQALFPSRQAVGVDAEGKLLLAGMPDSFSPNFPEPWLQLPLYRQDLATGAVEMVARADFLQNGEITAGNPFSAAGHATAWAHGFVTGRGNEAQLTWLDLDGRVTQLFRWPAQEVAFSDSDWPAYEAGVRMRWGGPTESLDEMLASQRAAARGPYPLFARLLTDPDGNVWIAGYNPGDVRHATRYQVVSSEGEWLGTVEVPPGLEILDIDREYLLGVERDSLGVEAVALYRLDR
jgi:hypothetical protein